MLHSENWKSNPNMITKQLYSILLNESKKDGKNIRDITELIFKYDKYLI
jgi:hypothetical protein